MIKIFTLHNHIFFFYRLSINNTLNYNSHCAFSFCMENFFYNVKIKKKKIFLVKLNFILYSINKKISVFSKIQYALSTTTTKSTTILSIIISSSY